MLAQSEDESAERSEETAHCWFDEPDPADRRSWVIPSAQGTYQGLDLELLDPGNEDDLTFLIEARHKEFEDALAGDEDLIADDEPFSPRLHIAMHQAVANQLLADAPLTPGRRFSVLLASATTGTTSCT